MAKKTTKAERVIAELPNNRLPEVVLQKTLVDTMRGFVTVNVEKLRQSARITWKAMHSGDLDDSFTTRITKGNSSVVGQVRFNFYGRFVDMGVGNGITLLEAQTKRPLTPGRNPSLISRRPKPWFTNVMAAERHRLAEVFSEKVSETLQESVAECLPDGEIDMNI